MIARFIFFSSINFFNHGISKINEKKTFEKIRTSISRLNVFVYEHIIWSAYIVKIFNQEIQELDKFKKINKEYTSNNIDSVLYFSIFLPVIDIFSAVSMGLIVWYGGAIIMDDLNLE